MESRKVCHLMLLMFCVDGIYEFLCYGILSLCCVDDATFFYISHVIYEFIRWNFSFHFNSLVLDDFTIKKSRKDNR